MSEPYQQTLTGNVALEADLNASMKYIGADIPKWIAFELNNFSFKVGHLGSWDGSNLATRNLEFRNSGTAKPDLIIGSVTSTNARLTNASDEISASAMAVIGGFDKINISNAIISNVSRAAGTGVIGGRGCEGLMIFRLINPLRNARSIIIDGPKISDILTDDAVDSEAYTDCDGIIIFQEDEFGQECLINEPNVRNCVGRHGKINASNATVNSARGYQSIAGKF